MHLFQIIFILQEISPRNAFEVLGLSWYSQANKNVLRAVKCCYKGTFISLPSRVCSWAHSKVFSTASKASHMARVSASGGSQIVIFSTSSLSHCTTSCIQFPTFFETMSAASMICVMDGGILPESTCPFMYPCQ